MYKAFQQTDNKKYSYNTLPTRALKLNTDHQQSFSTKHFFELPKDEFLFSV